MITWLLLIAVIYIIYKLNKIEKEIENAKKKLCKKYGSDKSEF